MGQLRRMAANGNATAIAKLTRIDDDAPPIAQTEIFFWTAFAHLQTHRPMGSWGGQGQIPFMTIVEYMMLMGYEDWEGGARIIVQIDCHHLGLINERSAKSNK